jgi:hypothetical protein
MAKSVSLETGRRFATIAINAQSAWHRARPSDDWYRCRGPECIGPLPGQQDRAAQHAKDQKLTDIGCDRVCVRSSPY